MKNILNIIFLTLCLTPINTKVLCSIDNCDERGGICKEDNTCECNENYTTLSTIKNYKFCNYERKRKLGIAFLELLVGFGMGHFYCGRKINGSIKLIAFTLLCCFCFCLVAFIAKISEDRQSSYNEVIFTLLNFYGLITNIIIFWQIYDFLMFIIGVYRDGNNIALY
jgi:hypothetical protein